MNIDDYLSIIYEMSDAHIIHIVLNLWQKQETNKIEESVITSIYIERCIHLTKKLIGGIEQNPFIVETHVLSVYKFEKLFLK